jgi:secreted trypsin-like serine protease
VGKRQHAKDSRGQLSISVIKPADGRSDLGISPQIINGVEAVVNGWPWHLSLQEFDGEEWSHICGASLLSSTSVLCAAHCVAGRFVNFIVILFKKLTKVLTGT